MSSELTRSDLNTGADKLIEFAQLNPDKSKNFKRFCDTVVFNGFAYLVGNVIDGFKRCDSVTAARYELTALWEQQMRGRR